MCVCVLGVCVPVMHHYMEERLREKEKEEEQEQEQGEEGLVKEYAC